MFVTVPPRIGPFSFGELIEGERAQVQCVVQAGDPPLTMNWFKDDRQLPAGLGIQVSKDAYSSTLAISRVDRLHAGQYTCLVEGPAKAVRVSAPLVVRGNVMVRFAFATKSHSLPTTIKLFLCT